jgi:hypothetical protein
MSPTTAPVEHDWLTVPETKVRFRIGRSKILQWIYAGQFRAVNIAADPNGRNARWRIERASFEAFLARRSGTRRSRRTEGGEDGD